MRILAMVELIEKFPNQNLGEGQGNIKTIWLLLA